MTLRQICFVVWGWLLSGTISVEAKQLRILGIGNSFTEDLMTQVPELIEPEDSIELAYLYYSGANLSQHIRIIKESLKDYTFRHYDWQAQTWKESAATIDHLATRQWDIIILQQSSPLSGRYETIRPALSELIQLLKQHQPEAQLAWHITWAYAQNATLQEYTTYRNNQRRMYYSICQATLKLMEDFAEAIASYIPSGIVIQRLREKGYGERFNDLCLDGYHADQQLGRYALALTFQESLLSGRLGKNISQCEQKRESKPWLSAEEDRDIRQVIQGIIHNETLSEELDLHDEVFEIEYFDLQGFPCSIPAKGEVMLRKEYYLSGKIVSKKVVEN